MSANPVVIGNATLYHGDAREILPSLQADVLITDPVWPNCPAGLLAGSDDPTGLFAETCAVWPQVKRAVIVMRHDCDPRFLAPVPLPFARTAWLPYALPSYIGRNLGGDELAYCFGAHLSSRPGRRVIPGRALPAQPTPRNGHPCSRSVGHFAFLVHWWSDIGEVVLDPFMGSCTTGIAAVQAGHPFIGIEIDAGYFDLACRRIEDAQRQGRMFA